MALQGLPDQDPLELSLSTSVPELTSVPEPDGSISPRLASADPTLEVLLPLQVAECALEVCTAAVALLSHVSGA